MRLWNAKFLILIGLLFVAPLSFADNTCNINVMTNLKVGEEGGAVFNAQTNTSPPKTYSSDIPVINAPKTIKVPCDMSYNISATPIDQSNQSLAGKYAYRSNPIYIPEGGSLSVTYPNDFPTAPQQ